MFLHYISRFYFWKLCAYSLYTFWNFLELCYCCGYFLARRFYHSGFPFDGIIIGCIKRTNVELEKLHSLLGLFFCVFWALLWCKWGSRYITVHTKKFLWKRLLEYMIFPAIFTTVFIQAAGRYMTKFLAVNIWKVSSCFHN